MLRNIRTVGEVAIPNSGTLGKHAVRSSIMSNSFRLNMAYAWGRVAVAMTVTVWSLAVRIR